MSNAFKFGFGAGLGLTLVHILFLLLGMALFFPGLIMLSKERKKPEGEKETKNIYIAYALMVVGCVLGLVWAQDSYSRMPSRTFRECVRRHIPVEVG